MKRKLIPLIILLAVALSGCISPEIEGKEGKKESIEIAENKEKEEIKEEPKVEVPLIHSQIDKNKNGVADPMDLVIGARREGEAKTAYKDSYYVGGYPPESEGVCTDVIWRAFKGIGVDIKIALDKDIKANTSLYPRVNGKPEPNIDFRRVPNQDVFFKRFAESLSTEIKPGDIENLKSWQPGDIVTILSPYQHVAIISDKRDEKGVPYIIHNFPPEAREDKLSDYLNTIKIKGHYRWKY